MSALSKFSGIVIRMLFTRTLPPHFHALAGDAELVVGIAPLRIIQGEASSAVRQLVLAWGAQHQRELLSSWQRCQNRLPLVEIGPLQSPADAPVSSFTIS